jgi:ATP-dependent DNA helicase RecQ
MPLTDATEPQQILEEVFGFDSFRGEQGPIIENVSGGGDALVLMPTGAGKSLCYQLPAIARQRAGHGITVVVSPLIALMRDQVLALHELGIEAAYLNSTLSPEDFMRTRERMLAGEITLLYAAPERVTNINFLVDLATLHDAGKLALFAIDEAHCVSQWGHDFRPEYQGLTVLHERFPDVPRIALTATADSLTRAEIAVNLDLERATQYVSSFDRPNIRYSIDEKKNGRDQLLRFIKNEHPGEAGIVYCLSRKKVEETAKFLSENGIPALPYHAGLDANKRQRHQDRFLREDGLVMTATIAFGMGIDKPDVRFVAHLDLPKNIEATTKRPAAPVATANRPTPGWSTDSKTSSSSATCSRAATPASATNRCSGASSTRCSRCARARTAAASNCSPTSTRPQRRAATATTASPHPRPGTPAARGAC